MKIKFRNYLVYFLYSLFIVELFSFLAVRYFHITNMPKAYRNTYLPFFVDNDKNFGVWHLKKTHTKHTGECWNVDYFTNSYGARDHEHTVKSQKDRIVFIGDSFTEGYGVQANERFSDLIAKEQNVETLNFGTSGNFGTTQAYLQYKSLVSKFDHNTVVMTVLPFNDFTDDDYTFSSNFIYTKNRYRPYWQLDSIGKAHKIIYNIDEIEKSELFEAKVDKINTLKGQFLQILDNNTLTIYTKCKEIFLQYSFSCALFLKIKYLLTCYNSNICLNEISSQWVNPNKNSLDILFHNLTLLKKEIGNKRKFIIVLALHPVEIMQLNNKQANKISLPIASFCNKNNIQLLDLSQNFVNKSDFLEYFLPCDGHWSAKGHKFVKDLIIQELKGSTKIKP